MNIDLNKNEDANKIAWSNIKTLLDKIEEGGKDRVVAGINRACAGSQARGGGL